MRPTNPCIRRLTGGFLFCISLWVIHVPVGAFAESIATKSDKVFTAIVTDASGVETEIRNLLFYWEEKVSETAFVPHELRYVPVKRGQATVHIKFEAIKSIDVLPADSRDNAPLLKLALTNGKTGEFVLAIQGSFKGGSDFGEVDIPVRGVKTLMLK